VGVGVPAGVFSHHGVLVQRGRRCTPRHARSTGEYMSEPLLSVNDLRTQFETSEGTVLAVDGVSFAVEQGETVCLVGESGSGKTVACESITKLLSMPPGKIVSGRIDFDGRDLTDCSPGQLSDVRGER